MYTTYIDNFKDVLKCKELSYDEANWYVRANSIAIPRGCKKEDVRCVFINDKFTVIIGAYKIVNYKVNRVCDLFGNFVGYCFVYKCSTTRQSSTCYGLADKTLLRISNKREFFEDVYEAFYMNTITVYNSSVSKDEYLKWALLELL